MSVIVSNGNTSLSTASGFLNVDVHNLSSASSTNLSCSTTRSSQLLTPFTPSACNLVGGGLSIYNITAIRTSSLSVELQEYKTATASAASPTIITSTTHGFTDLDPIRFSCTGTIPTGISNSTLYYVRYINANTFNISTTPAGALINVSNAGTPTLTVYKICSTVTITPAQITAAVADMKGNWWVPYTFPTPYAVTATATKYRLSVMALVSSQWYLNTSDGTNSAYFLYSDVAKTFADNDTVICKDVVTIDKSATFGSVLGTGDAVNGTACLIMRSLTPDPDHIANLVWSNPPAAPYTLTVKGTIWMSSHTGIRVGTSTNPIAAAVKATIDFATPTVGTGASKINQIRASGSLDYGRSSLFLYGAVPTWQRTKLTADANLLQKDLVVADSVDWVNGDKVVVGKQNYRLGQGDVTVYTVNSVAGKTITLNENVAGYLRKSGGAVVRVNRYGISLTSSQTVGYTAHYFYQPAAFQMIGVENDAQSWTLANTSIYSVQEESANYLQTIFQDCSARTTNSANSSFSVITVHPSGVLFSRVNVHRQCIVATIYAYYTTLYKSGRITIDDCVQLSKYSSMVGGAGTYNYRMTLSNCVFENSRASSGMVSLNGLDIVCTDNTFWGDANTAAVNVTGAMSIGQTINSLDIHGNKFDYCQDAIVFLALPTINVTDTNTVFGSEATNTNDIVVLNDALIDYTFVNATGITTVDKTLLTDTVPGSQLKFVDYNGSSKDDRVWLTNGIYQRCGTGLTDNTKYGTNTYSLRLEPLTSTNPLQFKQNGFPIGNCQNKDVTAIAYVNINNAAYYAGTHQLPRITINYDNGTTAYVQATNTTGWQRLAITFTPTTSYGAIDVSINGFTDAVGSNAYFYIGQFALQYPAGSTLNLGGIDYWANAKPVTPMFATLMSPKDIADALWDDSLTDHTISGSFGEKVTKDLTLDDFVELSE